MAGEGYERPALEALLRAHGAEQWISLPGYVDEDALVATGRSLFQRPPRLLADGDRRLVTGQALGDDPARHFALVLELVELRDFVGRGRR